MQHCLICGAASWGPAKPGFVVSGDFQIQLMECDLKQWRKCDSCGSLAQAHLIEQAPSAGPDATFGPSPLDAIFAGLKEAASAPSPMDKMTERMAALFETRMPVPETRLERLLKAVLHAKPDGLLSQRDQKIAAVWAVDFVRELEREMDREPSPGSSTLVNPLGAVPGAPWCVSQWASREDFVTWCSDILDRTRPGFGQGWNSKEWAEAIATELEGVNRD